MTIIYPPGRRDSSDERAGQGSERRAGPAGEGGVPQGCSREGEEEEEGVSEDWDTVASGQETSCSSEEIRRALRSEQVGRIYI